MGPPLDRVSMSPSCLWEFRVRVMVIVRVRVNPYPSPNRNHNQSEESPSNQSEARIIDLSYEKEYRSRADLHEPGPRPSDQAAFRSLIAPINPIIRLRRLLGNHLATVYSPDFLNSSWH